jgi:Zn-dependent protease
MAGGGVTLFRIRGIRIAVDYSWFVVLFLIIFWLTGFYRDVLNSPSGDSAPYVLAVASAALFFASILLHELGHAFVARRHDIGVSGITLWMFGGFARLEKDSDTPGTEFKIAIAGPLVTAAIVVVCAIVGLALAGSHEFKHAVLTQGDTRTSGIAALISWLGSINLLVLIFNLVPAFPLDGGRIARSIVWRVTGDKQRGTRVAARLGQGFAVLLAGVGVWLLVSYRSFTGLWLIAIGFLLGQSARGAIMQTAFSERIEGVRVADIMDPEPVAISSQTPVGQALEEFFLRYGWAWFPVVDEHGRYVGITRRERLDTVRDSGEAWLTVGSVLEAGEPGNWRVGEDRPITEVLSSDALGKLGALMAVDGEGVLRGVVTLGRVRRALQAAFSSPAA